MPHIQHTRHYAEQTAKAFPLLEEQSVVDTCTTFMRLLFGVVSRGHEIRILNSGPGVKKPLALKIYKQDFNVKRANYRAARGASRRRHERKVRAVRRYIRRELGMPPAADLFEINP